MSLIGTHRTITTGIAPAHRPTASLTGTFNRKLRLDLGRDVLLVSLGDSPTAALHALRDDLDALLTESKEN